mgnify:FL=1
MHSLYNISQNSYMFFFFTKKEGEKSKTHTHKHRMIRVDDDDILLNRNDNVKHDFRLYQPKEQTQLKKNKTFFFVNIFTS